MQLLLSANVLLELVTSVPFIITVTQPFGPQQQSNSVCDCATSVSLVELLGGKPCLSSHVGQSV